MSPNCVTTRCQQVLDSLDLDLISELKAVVLSCVWENNMVKSRRLECLEIRGLLSVVLKLKSENSCDVDALSDVIANDDSRCRVKIAEGVVEK